MVAGPPEFGATAHTRRTRFATARPKGALVHTVRIGWIIFCAFVCQYTIMLTPSI
jgi:hypothetical protein